MAATMVAVTSSALVKYRVGAGQQVPGVDQVGGAAEGGDLCKDSVDGGLQGDLQQVAEVSCRGEGPGVLDVEAGVLEGLSGLVGRLGQVGQKRRSNGWSTSDRGEGGGGRREEGGEEEGGKREEGRGRREEGGGGSRGREGGREEGGSRREE